MSTIENFRENSTAICYDASLLATLEPRVFDADWLRANGCLNGSSQGRNQAHFLSHAGHDMVLRHFYRGGLIGRVNKDLFLRVGPQKSRAFLEFDLLNVMRSKGLAVPRPVAARYAPRGLFYRADIITERIPNAQTLAEILQDKSLPTHLWTAIGKAIRKLHDHKVFHSDLNCRNIMIDADGVVWLIDFDKCRQRDGNSWKQDNINRLERSLHKVTADFPHPNWGREEWDLLLAGYAAEVDG